jgi:hypothetical protein
VGLYGVTVTVRDEDTNELITITDLDFLSGIEEDLDPTLAQFETTNLGANKKAVISKYNLKGYTPVNADDSFITDNEDYTEGDTEVVSADDQAQEFMASFGNSSFWQ